MATDIDSLKIEIKASADNASKSVEKLANSLQKFSNSLNVDTHKLSNISTGIRNLSDAATGFKGGKSAEISSLTKSLTKFSSVDTNSIYKVSAAIQNLSTGMVDVHSIDTSGILNVASAMSKMGGKNATTGANNLIKIKDDLSLFVQSMNNVGGLSFDMTGLNSLLNGISRLGNKASTQAVQNLSPLSAQLQNLIRQMNNIGSLSFDMTGLSSLVTAISKLGGVSVSRAVQNIPALANSLTMLMQTLARAPTVSGNVIALTNALANLSAQGAKVSNSSRSLQNSLNGVSASSKKATKSAKGLAAAFGKFYATYFLVIRGIKSLWKSIEGTTDYIEAFNYYAVSFGKIASEWSGDFEKYGYDSADAYAESFTDRVNEKLNKMSGLNVDIEKGLLVESGVKNLGLNIKEITQYASQLASVTNSLGQTGETTVAVTKSMTMLAGDISSLFNVDYQTVADNLQSGLIGQSRALYKYGIDITNATLATYAYNLGLSKSVTEMSQAEKQQLRVLAILDQSKVSWGDLANTINSPSNMIRQFNTNVKEAGMVLGQLFIPVLQKVMPIVNGVTIAIKRLLVSIASLLGIKIDFDAFGQGYNDISDGIGDINNELDKTGKNAKKAVAGLRAFDELKTINMPSTSTGKSGAGGGKIDLTDQIKKATEEYEKVWNEAFNKMANSAQKWADKIYKAFSPVMEIFKDLFNGDFFKAGKDVSKLVSGIFDYFSSAIKKVDWKKIGESIGNFLAGIDWKNVLLSVGNLFETIINAAIDLWKGSFDANPIGTTLATAIAALKLTGVGDTIKDSLLSLLPTTLSKASLTVVLAAIAWEFGFNVGKSLGKALFPDDKEIYDNFSWFGEDGFFKTIFGTDPQTLAKAFLDMAGDMTPLLSVLRSMGFEGQNFSDIVVEIEQKWIGGIAKMMEKQQELVKKVKDFFSKSFWDKIVNVALNALQPLIDMINNIISKINDITGLNLQTFIVPKSKNQTSSTKKGGNFTKFESGGFPRSYSAFIAGENGKVELMGTVGGKTAVAGNSEITGIKEAVYDSSQQEVELLRQQNQLLQALLNKEYGITEDAIGNAARNYAQRYYNKTGNPAYDF